MRMVRLDLISQQMQQLLIQLTGILADVQVIVVIRLEAGHQLTFLEDFHFAAFAALVQVLTNLKMVNLFVNTDNDWVIFHSVDTTIWMAMQFYLSEDVPSNKAANNFFSKLLFRHKR